MKTVCRSRHVKGFTLIELLVVITIVAVLAAMSFAGVQLAMKKAKMTDAKTTAVGLAAAVESFYNDYNRLPDLNQELRTDQGEGVELLRIVLAQEESGSDPENSRSIVYFSGKEAKGRRGGIFYGGAQTVQGLFDPWGNPYQVLLNVDYEDRLEGTFLGTRQGGSIRVDERNKNVLVFSPGPDMEAGTQDDIESWK